MLRVGVQFEKPPTAVQASLDRFVFGLLRRKAEAKRPISSSSELRSAQQPPPVERRIAPRVEIGPAEALAVVLLPTAPRGALGGAKPNTDSSPSRKLVDLSTTGCTFICPDSTVTVGTRLRLRLKGRDIDLEVGAKVMNVTAVP